MLFIKYFHYQLWSSPHILSHRYLNPSQEITMTHASTAHFSTDEAAELERNAYNAAFYELGFRWHWDGDTFASLQAFSKSCDRIRNYLETQHPHLLSAYDA